MTSRYRRHEDDEKAFRLEFQVCSDGYEDAATQDAYHATFTLFGALPLELRLKIWEYLLQPRIVVAACLEAENAAAKTKQLALRPKRPFVPALLHINHEARELALKHYELTFSWRIPPTRGKPLRSDAKVWFNFATDTLLLMGELEPFDTHNMNTPMVYFLNRDDTKRVRHVACAFEELHFSEAPAEVVFGCLFHIIDRFSGADRLLITSTQEDLETHKMMCLPSPEDNAVQKIWRGWINGTSVITSSLADRQILIVNEDGLADFIAENS